MASNKRKGKGFCPFCGMEFSGDHENCPFCGQDLRQYTDDLGPIMESIQTATNIDMKSPKARLGMSIIIFILVFAGALVLFDFYERSQDNVVPEDDDEPIHTDGLMVEVGPNSYLDLTGDFITEDLIMNPVFDPDLKFSIHLNDSYQGRYTKIVWVVQTDSFNSTNTKDPFYQKVTKERGSSSDIYGVTWDNAPMGRFWISAECFINDTSSEVLAGKGIFYGPLTAKYNWTYKDVSLSMEYEMSSDIVKECLSVDLKERVANQSKALMSDYISDSMAVKDLEKNLRSLFTMNFRYSDIDYTDFVLSFVQTCFPDIYDSYNYRVDDFWALPTEIVFTGCGDDEDRAILFCSILKSAGMKTGVIVLPQTVMAAVLLDIDESPIVQYAERVKGLYGRMFTVADTSSDLGLGLVRPSYDFSDDGMSVRYNGTRILILDRFEEA